MSVEYAKTLSSFTGSDLIVNFGPRRIGELQAISWAVQREKAPNFSLGSPDARSFSRGKRGIAGNLSFMVFDRDALIEELREVWTQLAPPAMFTAAGNLVSRQSSDFSAALDLAKWNRQVNAATTQLGVVGSDEQTRINVPAGFDVIRKDNVYYADMLPPFDIVMTFANEYGHAAFQKIYDLEILNEGSGISVDTMVIERQMTWIARRISPLMSGIYTGQSNGQITTAPVIIR